MECLCSIRSIRQIASLIAIFLSAAALLSAQTPSPKPHGRTLKTRWQNYVNRELGFSFSYPPSYRPSDFDGICKDNKYRRYLLCLRREDDPDTSIFVTLIVGEPFQLHPLNNGEDLPAKTLIRGHVFYCQVGGSMGVGFNDTCVFDLKGKALEFAFDPNETANTAHPEDAFVYKVLKTFRVLRAKSPE